MDARFPTIRHIGDLRGKVSETNGIRIYDRADHILANYNFADRETFQTPFDLECRGIVFDRDSGDIIARPFHKFFNLGEREQLHEVDFSKPHRVLSKLDGSMVFGLRVGCDLRFFTRGGPSQQATTAWARASESERAFVGDVVRAGFTPIFEWTAPDNRIVVSYPDNRLTLLAIREQTSGAYMSRREMQKLADRYGAHLVEDLGEGGDRASWADRIATVRAMKGIEGVVIAFDDGHRLKLKTEDYAIRHRAVGGLGEEKNVVKALLADALDDITPLLADDVRERLDAWRVDFGAALRAEADKVAAYLVTLAGEDQKGCAVAIQRDLDRAHQPIAFQSLKSGDPLAAIRAAVDRSTATRARMDDAAAAFALPRWELGIDLEE